MDVSTAKDPLSTEAALAYWDAHKEVPHQQVYLFHAHVYWHTPEDLSKAEAFHKLIGSTFASDPRVSEKTVHKVPIGPHNYPMFEVVFNREVFADFMVWMAINRPSGISILVHLVSPQVKADHTTRGFWVGPELPGAINSQFIEDVAVKNKGKSEHELISKFM